MRDVLAELASKLEWEMSSWASIELRVTETILQSRGELGRVDTRPGKIDYHYIETKLNQRFLDTSIGSPPEIRYQHFSDGSTSSMVKFKTADPNAQEWVGIGGKSFGNEGRTVFTDRPRPFFYYFVGQVPLHDALRHGTLTGTTSIAGRTCYSVVLKNVQYTKEPDQLEVTLDRETGIPLRVAYSHPPGKPEWIWQAETMERRGAWHFPTRSSYVSYLAGNPNEIGTRRSYDATLLSFNDEQPSERFRPIPSEGVPIHGGPPTREADAQSPAPREATATVQPTTGQFHRADPQSSSITWLPTLLLLCGVVAIAAAGILIWRRR
jgi:hypothetical protein